MDVMKGDGIATMAVNTFAGKDLENGNGQALEPANGSDSPVDLDEGGQAG